MIDIFQNNYIYYFKISKEIPEKNVLFVASPHITSKPHIQGAEDCSS